MAHIEPKSVVHRSTTASDLSSGDTVRLGVTHQVKIDGLDSWIRLEAVSQVREGEDMQAALARVGKSLAALTVNEIERQASVIVDANAQQRR